jgi:hypothetical protein
MEKECRGSGENSRAVTCPLSDQQCALQFTGYVKPAAIEDPHSSYTAQAQPQGRYLSIYFWHLHWAEMAHHD